MQRTPISSRALVSAGYDDSTRELEVEFHGGRVYRYRDVPSDVFQFLLRTREKGRFFNRMIASRYEYSDVSKPEPAEDDMLESLRASLAHVRGRHGS